MTIVVVVYKLRTKCDGLRGQVRVSSRTRIEVQFNSFICYEVPEPHGPHEVDSEKCSNINIVA